MTKEEQTAIAVIQEKLSFQTYTLRELSVRLEAATQELAKTNQRLMEERLYNHQTFAPMAGCKRHSAITWTKLVATLTGFLGLKEALSYLINLKQ